MQRLLRRRGSCVLTVLAVAAGAHLGFAGGVVSAGPDDARGPRPPPSLVLRTPVVVTPSPARDVEAALADPRLSATALRPDADPAPAAVAAPPADGPTSAPDRLPPVDVVAPRWAAPARPAPTSGAAPGSLHELVGPNRQPAWTTRRPFANTRAYVISPGQVEFESWWEGKFRKDDAERHRFLQEVSFGLPCRFQADLYWRVQTETGEETRWRDFQVEVRHAFAPWGCLFLNPTIYGEWKFLEDAPDAAEVKLLFAEDLGARGQWALNLFWEEEVSGEHERELGFSQAVSYALLDPCLSVGMEMKLEHTTTRGTRGDAEVEFLIGPTIQWRPVPQVHLDVAPLFGCTPDSPTAQVWVVFGIDLAPGAGASRGVFAPTSVRGR